MLAMSHTPPQRPSRKELKAMNYYQNRAMGAFQRPEDLGKVDAAVSRLVSNGEYADAMAYLHKVLRLARYRKGSNIGQQYKIGFFSAARLTGGDSGGCRARFARGYSHLTCLLPHTTTIVANSEPTIPDPPHDPRCAAW